MGIDSQPTQRQLIGFAQQGFVVVRNAIPQALLDDANAAVDRLLDGEPPPEGHVGHYFYWLKASQERELADLFLKSPLCEIAQGLVDPAQIEIAFDQVQVALNIPPFKHRPGGHHLDGYQQGVDEPTTFTMLAGVLLSDQHAENSGNLWVWPGTHRTHAAFFREHGPDSFVASRGHPIIPLPDPIQIVGAAGDAFLAHHMLGHNIGGNYESQTMRRAVYFRLQIAGHQRSWRECLCDELFEYEAVRNAVRGGPHPRKN